MKKIIIALLMGCALPSAAAVYTGRLDLTPDVAPFAARAFKVGGDALYGLEKPAWRLSADGHTELELSPFVGWRTGNQIMGGASIVVPGGGVDQLLDWLNKAQDLPQTLATVAAYAAYLKTGLTFAWYDKPAPAFIGYKVALQVPLGGS